MEIEWRQGSEDNCHYGTVQGRQEWSYSAAPQTDGKWRLSVHCGVLGLMTIGEFDALESAKTQALWIERNNKRAPQTLGWKAINDRCWIGSNSNAPIHNSWQVDNCDGL